MNRKYSKDLVDGPNQSASRSMLRGVGFTSEDFTKPLSLSFRLFGNVLADELVVAVLVTLVPLVVPIPLILLGLFTSAIQALVFSTLAGAYIGEAIEDHHLFLNTFRLLSKI